jgi:hypothetical protein
MGRRSRARPVRCRASHALHSNEILDRCGRHHRSSDARASRTAPSRSTMTKHCRGDRGDRSDRVSRLRLQRATLASNDRGRPFLRLTARECRRPTHFLPVTAGRDEKCPPGDICTSNRSARRGLRLLLQSFQNCLRRNRHMPHAHADRVIDCVGDRRRDYCGCGLADAARVMA